MINKWYIQCISYIQIAFPQVNAIVQNQESKKQLELTLIVFC